MRRLCYAGAMLIGYVDVKPGRAELFRAAICGALLAATGCSRPAGPAVTPATAREVLAATRNTGAKVVLVNMWASWCGSCRLEFPDLVKLERAYRDRGLKVVLVSWDDNTGDATKFLAKQGVEFASFIKSDKQSDVDFLNAFEPRWTGALPTTFLFDDAGKLRDFWEGAVTHETFQQKVESVMGGKT